MLHSTNSRPNQHPHFLFLYVLLFFLLVINPSLKAQSSLDSLVNSILENDADSSKVKAYDQIFRRMLSADLKAASEAADSLQAIANRTKNNDHFALALNRSGSIAFFDWGNRKSHGFVSGGIRSLSC